MDLLAEKVRENYSNIMKVDSGILDLVVSFDAAWEKRGHSSHIGIAFEIEANTGLVVALEVLSTTCTKVCAHKHQTLSPEAFEEWSEVTSHEYTRNHLGSASSMEAKAARLPLCRVHR